MVGGGSDFGLSQRAGQLRPVVRAAARRGGVVGGVGLLMQQLFLRWNQGQDLRQALITIAVSIILADQMLAHFGGVAQDISWPGTFDKFVNLHVCGRPVHADPAGHPAASASRSALGLWYWLKRTRTGMVIRAGVDDRDMVSAMGINIQLTFAIAFSVGSGARRAGRRHRRLVREPRARASTRTGCSTRWSS